MPNTALVALELPLPVRAMLKPLGDARLGVDLAIHHGNAGQIAVGHNLFQADLAVAQKRDESNEHGFSIERIDSVDFTMQRSCQTAGARSYPPVRVRRLSRSAKGGLARKATSEAFSSGPGEGWNQDPSLFPGQ
ncbi:MAG: hypothetical protein WAM83_19905 [Bradyrhizobium sp.]